MKNNYENNYNKKRSNIPLDLKLTSSSFFFIQAETLDVQVKYATLKEEAQDLTRKLKIFGKKYQDAKQEVKKNEIQN
jgi:hypothetical protein